MNSIKCRDLHLIREIFQLSLIQITNTINFFTSQTSLYPIYELIVNTDSGRIILNLIGQDTGILIQTIADFTVNRIRTVPCIGVNVLGSELQIIAFFDLPFTSKILLDVNTGGLLYPANLIAFTDQRPENQGFAQRSLIFPGFPPFSNRSCQAYYCCFLNQIIYHLYFVDLSLTRTDFKDIIPK